MTRQNDNTIETDFLIIGGGIAGPALASALSKYGTRIVLLEKNLGPIDTARGDHLQPYTLEILDRWGILDDFFQQGAEKRIGSIWYTGVGKEILNSSISELDIPWPYFLFLNHEKISEVFFTRSSKKFFVSRNKANDKLVVGGSIRFGLSYSGGDSRQA